jgi:endoglucanase
MPGMADKTTSQSERELIDLTNQPTAPACEQAVIDWVQRWVHRRRGVKLRRDRFGNMLLQREGDRARKPFVITAHMDHPAFVVTDAAADGRRVTGDFRGGVADRFFEGSRVRLWQQGAAVATGTVMSMQPATKHRPDKRATIQLDRRAAARPGDIITWRLPEARVQGDRLKAPVCDDLAGVAAALHAFDRLRRGRRSGHPARPEVRVLLTLCEEIGFIGALAGIESGLVPKQGRLVLLENSKSFAESPIGGGPIVRVGDRTSTFDPGLTYRIARIAENLARRDADFAYQRKLMPGGTCEATAYHGRGLAATCLCLPLGNYHNQNETTGRIDRETISLRDYHRLVQLLVEIGRSLDAPAAGPSLPERLDQLLASRRHLIEPRG